MVTVTSLVIQALADVALQVDHTFITAKPLVIQASVVASFVKQVVAYSYVTFQVTFTAFLVTSITFPC